MGGRGTWSTTGKVNTAKSGSGIVNVGGAPDKRKDIQKMFVDELGFTEIGGTNRIKTAILGSYGIALNKLERKYGAIANSENPRFGAFNANSATRAAVSYNPSNPAEQWLLINTKYLGDIKNNLKTTRAGAASGFNVQTSGKITDDNAVQTSGKITDDNAYVINHEYGHMLENVLVSKGITDYDTAAKEISSIATSKYGASSSSKVSRYGTTNTHEFLRKHLLATIRETQMHMVEL